MVLALSISACFALALDQITKGTVLARAGRNRHYPSGGWRPRVRPLLNRRLGLGLVRNRRTLLLVWTFAVSGTLLQIFLFDTFQTRAARIGLGVALGGATSNFLDFLLRGGVVDFIDVRIWPVFNIADALVICGVGMTIWSIY